MVTQNKNIKIKYNKKGIVVLLNNKVFYTQELVSGMTLNDCFLITLLFLCKFGLIHFDNELNDSHKK